MAMKTAGTTTSATEETSEGADGAIDARDLDLFLVTDDVDAALEHVERNVVGRFGVQRRPMRPVRILGERAA